MRHKSIRRCGLLAIVLFWLSAHMLLGAEALGPGDRELRADDGDKPVALSFLDKSRGALDEPLTTHWGRLLYGTTAVAGLICLGVFVLKKLGGGAMFGRGRYMDVLETRIVGRKVQLFLVKIAGRVVLLASNGENITSIAEFAEDELPLGEPVRQQRVENGFRSLLKSLGRIRQ